MNESVYLPSQVDFLLLLISAFYAQNWCRREMENLFSRLKKNLKKGARLKSSKSEWGLKAISEGGIILFESTVLLPMMRKLYIVVV